MKYVGLLLLFVGVSYGGIDRALFESFKSKIYQYAVKCIAETKANSRDIMELVQAKTPSRHQGKCLLFCFNRSFKIQNPDGTINKDGALKVIESVKELDPEIYELILEVFNMCYKTVLSNDDPCIYSSDLADCSIVESRNNGLEAKLMNIAENVGFKMEM